MATIRKVVLAYSGGLDTSVILKWLREHYGCEVVTFTADLGQGEELAPASAKAALLGVKEIFIDDLREEFVRDFVYPMFRANTLYEGEYLLGTSIARPLIAKRLVEIATEVGADAVAHGATGKGNDQVRFELGVLRYAAGGLRHRTAPSGLRAGRERDAGAGWHHRRDGGVGQRQEHPAAGAGRPGDRCTGADHPE
jgi:argininosuccinate synthase